IGLTSSEAAGGGLEPRPSPVPVPPVAVVLALLIAPVAVCGRASTALPLAALVTVQTALLSPSARVAERCAARHAPPPARGRDRDDNQQRPEAGPLDRHAPGAPPAL